MICLCSHDSRCCLGDCAGFNAGRCRMFRIWCRGVCRVLKLLRRVILIFQSCYERQGWARGLYAWVQGFASIHVLQQTWNLKGRSLVDVSYTSALFHFPCLGRGSGIGVALFCVQRFLKIQFHMAINLKL